MRNLLILLFCFKLCAVSAQLTPEVQSQLRTELAAQINAMRKEKQLAPLAFDNVLKQAAQVHSSYMAEKKKLSHEETVAGLKTPKARVIKQGGRDFELIGENIVLVKAPSGKPEKIDCAKIAKEMAQAWRKSPGHYANIMNASYTLGDFGFEIDASSSNIYATQVFGKRGITVPGQLSENAFGIVNNEANCTGQFDKFMNLIYNIGNAVVIKEHEVLLYDSNLDLFNRIFTGANDGIAVDLVRKDQFKCGVENQLDFSPVYDGIMLKPVYRKELMDGNQAASDYRLVTVIGRIPENLNPEDYEVSLILIKGGKKCVYLYPGEVPSGRMDIIPYEPELLDPVDVVLENQGIIQSVELKYDFGSNDTVPKTFPQIPVVKGSVSSVYIHSYTSVDGDSLNNVRLHFARARAIKKHLKNKLVLSEDQIRTDARENWELMRYQLLYYGAFNLLDKTERQIRTSYQGVSTIPWRDLFQQQRRSSATINYYSVLPENASIRQKAELNLRTALLRKEWDKANKAMAILCKEKQFPAFLTEEPYFSIIKSEPILVQNASALFTLEAKEYRDPIGQCLHTWIGFQNQLNPAAKRNLLYLYTIAQRDILLVWDLPAIHLSNVLQPARLIPLKDSAQVTQKELLFNLHLTFIEYYGQINDAKGIEGSFNYLLNYIDKEKLPIEKQIELALFCNSWSRYDLTIERLGKSFKEGVFNSESLMILLKTMSFYNHNRDEELYNSLVNTASVQVKTQFCQWVKKNFQLKRDERLKGVYCKTCEGK